VSRWQPDARERLESAALELFTRHGFTATTVPQITERAGLTTRTFFRHFADKREVLFADEGDLPSLAARMIAEAPASATPMEIIADNFGAVAAAQFAGGAELFRARKAVIDSDEGLHERELRKISALSDAMHAGFVDRGIDPLTATLVAQVTVTVFGTSIGRWLQQKDGDAASLAVLLRDTLGALRTLLADPGWDGSAPSSPRAAGSA
jgi:AcrR family transcriptional regulator